MKNTYINVTAIQFQERCHVEWGPRESVILFPEPVTEEWIQNDLCSDTLLLTSF
jgi:hypothetical protein